jgi:hypothetical protein
MVLYSIFNVDTDATVFALISIASYNVVTCDFDDIIVYVILEQWLRYTDEIYINLFGHLTKFIYFRSEIERHHIGQQNRKNK